MHDAADEIEQQLRCKDGRGAGVVVVRRDFDEINSHHRTALYEACQQFKNFIIEKSTVAWRSGAGRYRRIKAVDVDRNIVAAVRRDTFENRVHAQLTELPHRENVGPHAAGILIAFTRR